MKLIDKDAVVAEIEKLKKSHDNWSCMGKCFHKEYDNLLSFINTLEVKEVDEEYKVGKWFTGLIPCWVDAPSTLQPSHNYHGKNIVAIHLKDGGYRCCCVDDEVPTTFSLAEDTHLVEGWKKGSFRK